MPVTIGDVRISAGDAPEKFPIGGKSTGEAVTLSDGTEFFQATGYTPNHIQITGTLYLQDGGGDPIARMSALIQMNRRTDTVWMHWGDEDGTHHYTTQVQVIEASGQIIEGSYVEYTIVLFIETPGALQQAARVAQRDLGRTMQDRHRLLNTYSQQTGPLTAAAWQQVLQARQAIPDQSLTPGRGF